VREDKVEAAVAAQRRTEIVGTASTLFAQRVYKDVNASEIPERARVSRRTFFFATKE
jgi:AcrR family transcriptional regulator